jgi:hypothetical protein
VVPASVRIACSCVCSRVTLSAGYIRRSADAPTQHDRNYRPGPRRHFAAKASRKIASSWSHISGSGRSTIETGMEVDTHFLTSRRPSSVSSHASPFRRSSALVYGLTAERSRKSGRCECREQKRQHDWIVARELEYQHCGGQRRVDARRYSGSHADQRVAAGADGGIRSGRRDDPPQSVPSAAPTRSMGVKMPPGTPDATEALVANTFATRSNPTVQGATD